MMEATLSWLTDAANWGGDAGIWMRLLQHVSFTLAVVVFSLVIAFPAGVAIGHTGKGKALVTFTSGAARALPTLGLLTIFALALGIGLGAPFWALVILAVPTLLTGAYSGVESANRSTVDAARAMGMTEWQVVSRVELPAALPIMYGSLRTTILQVAATATLAAYTADIGLGRFIFSGMKSDHFGEMIGGSILVVALTLFLDLILVAVKRLSGLGIRNKLGNATSPQSSRRFNAKGLARGLGALAVVVAIVFMANGVSTLIRSASTGSEATLIVVGSQDYYENEIIAEAYAQALEANGYDVQRSFRIGQREIYMPELEAGKIDLMPEYTGNLLHYYDENATETSSDEVYEALGDALPDGLRALAQADATDTDSYVVSKDFSERNGVTSIADLAGIAGLRLAGNSELQERDYGPSGLKNIYGVEIAEFEPVEDSGGPLTIKALQDGETDVADMYSSSPALASGTLVMLEDPLGMFLASHVVPIASDAIDDNASEVIGLVSAALTQGELVRMNDESVNGQRSASEIAHDFLVRAGILQV